MRKLYLAILIVITSFLMSETLMAQKNSGFMVRRADGFYDKFDFRSALELYKIANKKSDENLYVKARIGNCYKFLSEIQNAEEWYAAVANEEETDPIYKFYYAQSLMANSKYDEAKLVLEKYYAEIANVNGMHLISEDLFKDDDRYSIEIQDFNSKHADFSPFVIADELYFVSNRLDDAILSRNDVWSERPFTQLYRVNIGKKEDADSDSTEIKKSKKELEVFNKSTVSKRYHEGPLGLDPVKNDIYFTRSNYSKRKAVKGEDDEVNLKILKVAFVKYDEEGLGDFGGVMVDNCSFSSDEYSVAYPSLTIDGNYMVFASDMPGGFGGLDLYVAENIGGMWADPVNLGSSINTPGNEAFPHIMGDGTLYFASDGHFGLGGYDLFESKLKEDGTFDFPVNMRSPLNSTFDDFGLWMDENRSSGYFTSNRPSEYGGDDIYSFTREAYILEAIVYDSKTEERLENAEVVLINLDSGKEQKFMTDGDGYITSDIVPNSRYSLKVSKEEYLPEFAEFVTGDDNVYAEIPLVKDYGIVLDVTVIDQDTKNEIPYAEVLLVDLGSEKEYQVTTNKYGKTSFVIDPDREYRIKASKDLTGVDSIYLSVTKEFNTFGTQAPAQLFTVIELKKQPLGVDIIIEDILYDLDKYYIRPDAAIILDRLVKVLLDNPTIEIELASHTDCRATQKYNMWLSAKRAEAAVNYLIEKGIDYRRLTAAGYGESQPLEVGVGTGLYCTCEGSVGPGKTDPRCTEAVHQLNRRTVFNILKK